MVKKNKSKVNIREIAKKAGVSVASVSRALQIPPSEKISPVLRKKILTICDELQYSPNMHTVRMFSKRANTIAFIYPPYEHMHDVFDKGQMDPGLGACISGAEEYFSARSIYLTLTSTTNKFIEQKEYLKIIRSKMVDGILLWGWTEKDKFLYELIEEKVPVVMIQNEALDVNITKVVADDYQGMKAVTEDVIAEGHRKIAVVAGGQSSSAGVQRLRGVLETLKKFNIEPCYISPQQGFGFELGYLSGKEFFSKQTGATCIIAPSDATALGIIEAAAERNIKVPDDISITGADGIKLGKRAQLTTYISPSFDIGHKGAELLLGKIENPSSPVQEIRYPTSFIKGQSVKTI
jgi:LacI family transcriptional regulator, galactose operon repressor